MAKNPKTLRFEKNYRPYAIRYSSRGLLKGELIVGALKSTHQMLLESRQVWETAYIENFESFLLGRLIEVENKVLLVDIASDKYDATAKERCGENYNPVPTCYLNKQRREVFIALLRERFKAPRIIVLVGGISDRVSGLSPKNAARLFSGKDIGVPIKECER